MGLFMRLFLIRHAQAGDRSSEQRDVYRPLSPPGRRRADELAQMLGHQPITRILSSPAARCVQTVAPLAGMLGLTVDEQPELWEGTAVADVLALLEHQSAPTIAACSHGDVIPDVIDALSKSGAAISGRGCEKGSVWILDHDGRHWTAATYLDRSHSHLPRKT
jgi:8-oxo-dGTP diphosphatase